MTHILVLLLFSFGAACCQRLPDIPCPNVFRYTQENGLIYGVIEVPTDYSGVYEIAVNVSLAALLNKANIRLTMLTTMEQLNRGANPVYRVDFPIQTVIPKITQVIFNKRVYCFGDPEPLTSRGVTNMWASRSLITNIIPTQNAPFQPTPQSPYPNNPFLNPVSRPTYQIGSVQRPNIPVQRPPTEYRPPPIPPTPRPPPPTPETPSTTFSTTSTTTSTTTIVPFMNPAIMERDQMECGIFSQQLIVGGEEVEKGEFPWLVAILQRLQLSYKYRCTGNLVSNRHVISAGHCFKIFHLNFDKEDFTLVLGKQDIYQWAIQSIIRGVKEMYIHENLKANTGDNDIAVLTMDQPVEFTNTVKPICLWSGQDEYDIVGKSGTVIGWGTDGLNNFSQKAKKINLTVVSNEDCLRAHWGYINITSERTFCAGGQGVGPCVGDSGAGLVMQRDGRWTLRGIVSQALQSNGTVVCDLGKYIVFADVKSFTQWIRVMMSK